MKGNLHTDKNGPNDNDNEEGREPSIFFNNDNDNDFAEEFEKIIFPQQGGEDVLGQQMDVQLQHDAPGMNVRSFQNDNQNAFDPFSMNPTNVQQPFPMMQDQTQFPMAPIDQKNLETQPELKIADVFTHRIEENNTTSFLVRFENKSYRSKTWISNPTDPFNQHKIRLYLSQYGNSPRQPPFYPEYYDIPIKILTHRTNGKENEYLVLWKGLDRKDATWETRETLQNDALIQDYFTIPTDEEMTNEDRTSPIFSKFLPIHIFPQNKQGIMLSQVQLQFLNILAYQWYSNYNALIYPQQNLSPNDMKVVTCVFLNYIYKNYHQYGPFLIITQLCDIQAWENELLNWTDMKFLTFTGSQIETDMILKYEIFYQSVAKYRFQILITTSELIKKTNTLKHIEWVALIADQEAKLKPLHHQRFYSALNDIKAHFRLALITSWQSIPELISIYNFLKPNVFPTKSQFNSTYGSLAPEGQFMILQKSIYPYTINSRAYNQPEAVQQPTELDEKIIKCSMTSIQCSAYRSIFIKNQDLLKKAGPKNLTALYNICVSLNNVCSHPFLNDNLRTTIFKEFNDSEDTELKLMMLSSGKLLVLDRLLKQFQTEMTPLLLCTQSNKLVNILRTFLECKGYPFQLLDNLSRNNQIYDNFLIYLVCTPTFARAMDDGSRSFTKIILFDSDWKPQNDLIQVTEKFHQLNNQRIQVFRLLTQQSFESILYDMIMNTQRIQQQNQTVTNIFQEMDKIIKDPRELDKLLKMSASFVFQPSYPLINDESAKQLASGMIQSCQEIETAIQNPMECVYQSTQNPSNPFNSFLDPHFITPPTPLPSVDEPHFWKNIVSKYQLFDTANDIFINRSFPPQEPINRTTSSSVLSPQMPSPPTLPQSPVQMQTSPPPLQQAPSVARQKAKARPKPKAKPPAQTDAVQQENNNDQQFKKALSAWDKKQSTELVTYMTKFGYTRLTEFQSTTSHLDPIYFLEIGKLFIRWLVSASSLDKGQFPLIDQVTSSQISDFEDKFSKQKKDKIFSTVTQNAKAKIGKIHTAEFLHLIVSTSPSIDDIPVPEVPTSVEVAYYNTPQDDRLLMQLTWERGLGDVSNDLLFEKKKQMNAIPQDHNDVFILPFSPADRIKSIINAFVKLFQTYTNNTKQTQIPINHNTCSIVVQQITKTDHNQIIHAMDNYDFTNIDDFVQKVNLHKNDEFVKKYIETILNESRRIVEASKLPNQVLPPGRAMLASPISLAYAQKILKQKELFDKLHEYISKNSVPQETQTIIEIVFQWGFSTAITRPEVKNFLNAPQPQVKTLKQALKKLISVDAQAKKTSPIPTSSVIPPHIPSTVSPPLQQNVPQQQYIIPQFNQVNQISQTTQPPQLSSINNPPKAAPNSSSSSQLPQSPAPLQQASQPQTTPEDNEIEEESSESSEMSPPPRQKRKSTQQSKQKQAPEPSEAKQTKLPPKPTKQKPTKPIKEERTETKPSKPVKHSKPKKEKTIADENPELSSQLPLDISQSLKLIALGHVEYTKESFHTERYAYCPGYISEKLFTSCLDPRERIWYRSLILDGGDNPLFRVEVKDHPDIYFEGTTPSNPWLAVRNEVEKKKSELGLPVVKRVSCSGPEFYGLAVPTVANMIMRMKNIDKCKELKRNNHDSDDGIKPRRVHIQTTPMSPPEIRRERKRSIAQNKRNVKDYSESGNYSSSYEASESEGELIPSDEYSDNHQYIESDSEPSPAPEKVHPPTHIKQRQQPPKKTVQQETKEYSDDYDYYYSYYSDYNYSYSSDDSDIELDYPKGNLSLKFDFKKLLENPPQPEIFISLPEKATEELYNTLSK